MKIKKETIAPSEILYMQRVGAYGEENRILVERFKKWAADRGLLGEASVILAAATDNPAVVPAEKCRYTVGVINSCGYEPTSDDIGVYKGKTDGGSYIVLEIDHTASAVAAGWGYIPEALRQCGCAPDMSRPITERYAAEMVSRNMCEICIPIK